MTGSDTQAAFEQMYELFEAGDFRRAINHADNLAPDTTDNAPFATLRGHAHANLFFSGKGDEGDLEKAIDYYKKVIALYDEEYPILLEMDPELAAQYRKKVVLVKYNLLKCPTIIWEIDVERENWDQASEYADYFINHLQVSDLDNPELAEVLQEHGVGSSKVRDQDDFVKLRIGKLFLLTDRELFRPHYVQHAVDYLKKALRSANPTVKGDAALHLGSFDEQLEGEPDPVTYLLDAVKSPDEKIRAAAQLTLVYRHIIRDQVAYARQLLSQVEPPDDPQLIHLHKIISSIAYYSSGEDDLGQEYLEEVKIALEKHPDEFITRPYADYYMILAALTDDLELLKVCVQLGLEHYHDPQLHRLLGTIYLVKDEYELAIGGLLIAWMAAQHPQDLGMLFYVHSVLGDYPGLESLRATIEGLDHSRIFLEYLDLFQSVRESKWSTAIDLLKELKTQRDDHWYGLMISNALFGASFFNPPTIYDDRDLYIDAMAGLVYLASGDMRMARYTFERIQAEHKHDIVSLWGLARIFEKEGQEAKAAHYRDLVDAAIVRFRQRREELLESSRSKLQIISSLKSGELVLVPKKQAFEFPTLEVQTEEVTAEKKLPIDRFNRLEIEIPSDLGWNTKIPVHLLGRGIKVRTIEISQMQASILLFLAAEKHFKEKDWLVRPENPNARKVLRKIYDLLVLRPEFVKEALSENKPKDASTWVWDFQNNYRSSLISRIHSEVRGARITKDTKGELLIVSKPSPNPARKANYSLNDALEPICAPLF